MTMRTCACVMLLGACSFLVPDARTPVDRARAIEPKCRTVGDDALPTAEKVEPSYAHVLGGPNSTEARLRGARVHLEPLAGATRESLTRALECHQARVVLGQAVAVEDDPYVLPNRWLTIEVSSVGDGFVAVVESDDLDDARVVLDRARRWAARVRR
jgi:hypothetical protein